jgi:hypothetical protein
MFTRNRLISTSKRGKREHCSNIKSKEFHRKEISDTKSGNVYRTDVSRDKEPQAMLFGRRERRLVCNSARYKIQKTALRIWVK